ncbi:MAG: RnfABCDGE type electron transport complex subunit D [Synergistaceae bacterium]|nr:RnfABCDGE type electron transport complex subunit D [Synergistaceae bacterium]
MTTRLTIASSPHVHSPLDTRKIMGTVLLALAPAGLAGLCSFGIAALWPIVTCVVACVASEHLWQRLRGRPSTVRDLSAVVTGLLLAYNLPPTIPLWMAAVGSVFAIIVVKQFYGGLGCNIVNPALAARAMMLISWPIPMTTWTFHGVSGATPLAVMKMGTVASGSMPPLMDMLLGNMGGCIGETSSLLLILGGLYLIWEEIISWRIPVVYIVTTAALASLFGHGGGAFPHYEILSGGLILGAFFMATDYTTSPMTARGQYVFAFGCGLLTALIRTWGGYPEGASYSILIMNVAVPLIDRCTVPKILGEPKRAGKGAKV